MRILIVEDEKEIADGLQTILEKERYEVDAVYDGLKGLDYLLANIYDIALLDIMLPKINGIDILKNARSEGIKIPIILLTAKCQTEDKILGLDNGADDYLTKPFEAGELLARIRARTRNCEDSVNEDLCVGDIKLERSTLKLCGHQKSVKLGNKEFQLLEYLMMNKNQILTRDMLILKVWGFDEKTEYNNLEVYISFLRKKLKFLDAHAQIITTKGVGYSIEEGNSDD